MEKQEIRKAEISTPFIKLDSLLKFSGPALTGGQAKEMILSGAVLVNGEECLQRGKKIYPGDKVAVDSIHVEVSACAE